MRTYLKISILEYCVCLHCYIDVRSMNVNFLKFFLLFNGINFNPLFSPKTR